MKNTVFLFQPKFFSPQFSVKTLLLCICNIPREINYIKTIKVLKKNEPAMRREQCTLSLNNIKQAFFHIHILIYVTKHAHLEK